MAIDPTTLIGKLRLRVGDWNDLPIFPDAVYQSTLDENNNNLPKSAQIMAQYLLAVLAQKTHKKMAQMEIWGSDSFANYRQFLLDTVNNPAFMSYSPIAYSAESKGVANPLVQFVEDWNNNWNNFTVSENMSMTAWGNDRGI